MSAPDQRTDCKRFYRPGQTPNAAPAVEDHRKEIVLSQ
jgi:hypothetical protein